MFRPWGLFDWVLGLCANRRWFLVGALGTESRSLATWLWLRELGIESGCCLLEIEPIEPSRFSKLTRTRLEERRLAFVASGGSLHNVRKFGLLTELHLIDDLSVALEQNSNAVILDISSLPKRFFFPLLRSFYNCQNITDLIVTYTRPLSYCNCLSENPGMWEHLPGFPGKGGRDELLIVGVGFLVESLQQSLSSIEAHKAIQLFFPFPAPMPAIRRSLEALYNIRAARDPSKFRCHRIAAADMSSTFNKIKMLTRNEPQPAAFAPFGPKPQSAAMCLYASQRDCAIYYPQPRYYNPDYSMGIASIEGKRAVFGYWIKHAGRSLYNL